MDGPDEGFIEQLAAERGVPVDHPLVLYLVRKTKAASRGSKARRSLGNLYALLVLAEDYSEGRVDGSRFTDLLARMRALPFGSKLQNHPLDNRLNDEFARQYGVSGELLPVQATEIGGQKARRLSPALLESAGHDPGAICDFVVAGIRTYIERITEKQAAYLEDIESISDRDDFLEFLDQAVAENADARLFEIVSYVLLREHFRGQHVWIGPAQESVTRRPLELFRTGRTNANDGGIDFVLQPSGRFFQVTETLDFGKYFLDFEKVNRYPFTFVVKTTLSAQDVREIVRIQAQQSGRYSDGQITTYLSLFEEIFTVGDLRAIANAIELNAATLGGIKEQLRLQFQLEYGLLD